MTDENGDWKNAIPEEYRNEKMIQDVPDIGTLAKIAVDTKKWAGGAIRLPGSDASPEDWEKSVASRLRPNAPEDYAVGRPDDVPETEWDGKFETWFRHAAHKAGLHSRQAVALSNEYNEYRKARNTEEEQAFEKIAVEAHKALKSEWGTNYEARIADAQKTARKLGGDALNDLMGTVLIKQENGTEIPLGSHPAIAKAFWEISQITKEDGMPDAQTGGAVSTEDMENELDELYSKMSDPNVPYREHVINLKKAETLREKIHRAKGVGQ